MKHNYIILKLYTALLVLICSGLSFNVNSQEHGWEQMSSMNIARNGAESCVIENKIYVFGGATGGLQPTASVEIYDTVNNEWTPANNMPLPNYIPSLSKVSDEIFLMGGWTVTTGNWHSVNTNLLYDPEADSYSERQSVPLNIGFAASCVFNNLIYTFGGFADFEVIEKKSWIYDPNTDKWDSICDMKYQLGDATAQVINNKIYVIGGGDNEGNISGKVEMYDPSTDSWEEKAELPHPVTGHKSVVYNDKILVFGGDTGVWENLKSYGSNLIQEYDPVENKWEIKHGMPFKRSLMTGQKVGKYVYIIGGKENSRNFDEPWLSDVWRFNLDSLQDPIATDVIENKITSNLKLHQNFPNPFREYTQIKYDLQREGVVKLQVFSFLGQEITTLVNKYQRPGSYEVTWNAKNIKPGIYFVKLRTGDFGETKKAVVY